MDGYFTLLLIIGEGGIIYWIINFVGENIILKMVTTSYIYISQLLDGHCIVYLFFRGPLDGVELEVLYIYFGVLG